jgi:Mrp family chromosome partitioning ATPase
VLTGSDELEEVIKSTCVSGLDILTCGPDVQNPSETLHSENFAKVMKLLAKQYDRIIVDSPPVLPVTDAQILASICQVTILVLRAEKSTRKASQQAYDALVRAGTRILGVVVNDAPKNGRYGYYGDKGYYDSGNDAGSRKNKTSTSLPKSAVVITRSERPESSGSSGSLRIAERQKVLPVRKKAVVSRKESAGVYDGT